MMSGPGSCGGCGSCHSCRHKKFSDPTGMDLRKTLGHSLICTADSLRDMYTQFGLRPYKVRIIQVRWSAGERGVGTATIEKSTTILPTPLIQDMSTLTAIVNPVGLDEIGTIIMSEISGRYTEEELTFHGPNGAGQDVDAETFIEIEFLRVDGKPSEKRRFYPRSAPAYMADRFQWQIRLERAHEDRQRNGDYE